MPIINTAGVISKPNSKAAEEILPGLLKWLEEHHITARLDEQAALYIGATGIPREEVPEGCDTVIVLGGDGTLLSAARAIGRREIPLFPVNVGGLGFLTAITVDELYPELERLLRGEHRIAHRKLMATEVVRDGQVLQHYDALNDTVLTNDRPGHARRRAVRVPLQGRRAHHRDADRIHGVLAFGRRPDHLSDRPRPLHHAHLPAHAD
jgi:NAD+ kinase